MKQLSIHPQIYQYDSLEAFFEAFSVGKGDLVVTNRCILSDSDIKRIPDAVFLWQEDYGIGEPSDDMINGMRSVCRQGDFRRVIAIGGGTVLDIAKILVLPFDASVEGLCEPGATFTKVRELVLVPTTCGTGSEMTNISIVTLCQKQTKLGIVSDTLYGDAAVLIPALIDALPYKPFAASLIDALIHSVESYLSPRATAYTKLFSQRAMELILNGLKDIRLGGLEQRCHYSEAFLQASNLAGIAFGNAGCGPVHAMSYPLGATFHVPHGFSNYTLFTEVLRSYHELEPDGRIAGLEALLSKLLACGPAEVYDELEDLLSALYPRCYMCDFGVREANIPVFIKNVQEKQSRLMRNACVPLDASTLEKIYRRVLTKESAEM